MHSFKSIALFIVLLSHLIACRPFGSVIYDLQVKCGIDISDLRRLEKIAVKRKKAELDVLFLKNCKLFNVIPKFLSFHIPHGSSNDLSVIRKRLLNNALKDRLRVKRKLDSSFDSQCTSVKSVISSLDWYILKRTIDKKVLKANNRTKSNTRKSCAI